MQSWQLRRENRTFVAGVMALVALGLAGRPAAANPFRSVKEFVERKLIARYVGPALDGMLYWTDEALDLNLTDPQKKKIRPVLVDGVRRLLPLRNATTPEGRETIIRDALLVTRSRVYSIVAPEQGQKIDSMQARLSAVGLTPLQRGELLMIFSRTSRLNEALQHDRSLSNEQRKARAAARFEEARIQVDQVLTHEQQEKVRALVDVEMAANVLGSELSLTADQKSRAAAILSVAAQQAQSLRADSSLAMDQKQAKLKESHAATDEQLKTILTPEQQQQLKEFRERTKTQVGSMGLRGVGNSRRRVSNQ